MSPVIPRPGRPDDRLVRVGDDDGVPALEADARAPEPLQFHAVDSATRRSPGPASGGTCRPRARRRCVPRRLEPPGKGGPGAPAQSAPPVGGREEGPAVRRVSFRSSLSRRLAGLGESPRRQTMKKPLPLGPVRQSRPCLARRPWAATRASGEPSPRSRSPPCWWPAAGRPARRPRPCVADVRRVAGFVSRLHSGRPERDTGEPEPGQRRRPAPPIDEAAVYRQIEDQVIALRGLPAKQRLEPTDPRRGAAPGPDRGPVPGREPAGGDRGVTGDARRDGPPAGRHVARRPVREPPRVPGRRLLRPDDEADLRRRADGPDRGDREGHLRPRVHARAPGPELRPEGDHDGHRRAG